MKAIKMSLTSFALSREAADLGLGSNEWHPDTDKHTERDYIEYQQMKARNTLVIKIMLKAITT